MDLPKRNKLMLMFLAPTNPILKRMKRFATGVPLDQITLDTAAITQMAGVSRETPTNWANGGVMRGSKADHVFDHAIEFLEQHYAKVKNAAKASGRQLSAAVEREYLDLRARIRRYDAAMEDATLPTYDIARLLGMKADECQQSVDTAIFDRWPLLPSVYYPARNASAGVRDLAEEETERYAGIYLMWVRRSTRWLQAPLRVRYLFTQNAHKGECRFIRCKLNFPNLRPGRNPEWHEYDGILSIRPKRLFFIFEKRQTERQDFFQFITTVAGAPGTPLSLHGRYLTTGQDEEQSVVTDDVFLDFMFCEKDDPYHDRYRDLMWKAAKEITDPAELQKVEQRWKALQLNGH